MDLWEIWTSPYVKMIVTAVIAVVVCWIAFYPILDIAKRYNIVDNPDVRKLQKEPVPVLGGVVIFLGLVVALCYFKATMDYISLFPVIGIVVVMMYIGVMDDVRGITPHRRFAYEIAAGFLMIYGNHNLITDFQGVLGIGELGIVFSMPLSIIAFVGIINAMNMIDGVDGLLSALSLFACLAFGVVFFVIRDLSFSALAFAMFGAIIPFLIHNIFGIKSKMFLGDGGSMIIGTVLSALIFGLFGQARLIELALTERFSIVAFSLAVISIPIFDTLRVMFLRILKGRSPFSPDKNHLHHMLLDYGFSHRMVSMLILFFDVIVVAIWSLAFHYGGSPTMQFITVVGSAMLLTFILFPFMRINKERNSVFYRWVTRYAISIKLGGVKSIDFIRGLIE